MKKLLLAILIVMILPMNVLAECSDDDLVRLQRIANNVNTSYVYDENTNTFTIIFANFSPELILTNINNNQDYYYSDELSISNLNSGKYTYYIYASDKNCYDNELGVKSISLPYYNKYYDSDECKNIEDFEYCSKWLPNQIPYSTWKKRVTEHKEKIKKETKTEKISNKKTISDKIREFITDLYVSYYYVFLPIIIVAFCAIIYLKNKSDEII